MERYSFRDGGVLGTISDALTGSSYWLDDQVVARAFGAEMPAFGGDLITIAASCYIVDRLVPRRNRWIRELPLELAVRDPARWSAAKEALEGYLRLLTDDIWDITFIGGRRTRTGEHQVPLLGPNTDITTVALFSGGLDSFAGAARWLRDNSGGSLALVGSRSSTVIGADQRRLTRCLQEVFGSRPVSIRVPVHLQRSVARESSQRTRGMLFLALAVAAAAMADIRTVLAFENGFGALNPRLGEHQQGAQATKSMHPEVLARFQQFVRAAGYELTVQLPYRWATKAELLGGLPEAFHGAIALTSSCDSYPIRRPSAKQCGTCGSCVLRRQSLVASRLVRHDRRDYQSPPLSGDIARLMARQAWLIERTAAIEDWGWADEAWPELALGRAAQLTLEEQMTRSMLVRYAAEWTDLVERDSRLRRILGWPVGPQWRAA
jgi:7-cyano-7-deazaguanine synthase in queuosine biosynthesis